MAGVCHRAVLVWVCGLALLGADSSLAALLWSDLGSTHVQDTGLGVDILSGVLKRTRLSSDTLYFKFRVDPLSDSTTEEYFAAFQLFEGDQERLAVGNALRAWAYSAYRTAEIGSSNQVAEYVDLNSSRPEPSGVGTFYAYELPHAGIGRTIVFKVQYMPGGGDLVTVWLDPDLRAGATESGQVASLVTRFKADASFDQIRLRHGGGGGGWTFSEMAIATTFGDLVNANEFETGGERLFAFRSWQREQGLPENFVRALAQTRDGYIWVGSDEGVCWFDGVNFFPLGLHEGFQSGPVGVLLGDSRGALWIGGVDAGLGCWQAGKLRQKFNTSDGLPSDSITALAQDPAGRLWVGTQAGLAILQSGRVVALSGAEIFANKTVTTLFCDRQGRMWVGATGAGIYSFQDGKFAPLREASMDKLLEDPHCLLVDQAGRIWIGAGDAFVLCRDGKQWLRFGMPRHLATHSITALVETPDETVWAGSAGEGLFEFKAGKLVAINASSGLSDNLVESLLVDHEGKLWVGTHGGLNRICSHRVSVMSHNEGLDYGETQGLAEVSPGVIWAAQPSGVFQWDGQIFRQVVVTGLSPQVPSISTLLAGGDGSCWVAGAFGLLHFKNPGSVMEESATPFLTNLNISALEQNAINGEIWAGTRQGELWHLGNGKWQAWTNFHGSHAISGIVRDAKGTIWVGTQGDGLYGIDSQLQTEPLRGLPSGWIRALHLDAENTLWIGTAGGLSRLRNREIFTFTMRDGLPDNTISQILEDTQDNLWLGGNRGIIRVRKSDLDDLAAHKIPAVYPPTYGRDDGMLSEECTTGFSPAGLRTKTGQLWFPTLKGFVVLDPGRLASSPPPAIALQQILVDGVPKTPDFSWGGSELRATDASLSDPAQSLRVGPGKHTLEFRYTGLSFDAPERVRFRYRLEALDPDWVEAGTRRTAFYSFVPPGSYRFRVIACNGDGVWNENGASLTLTVLAHFWQTWWFIGGAVLGTVLVGMLGGRFVVRRRMEQRLKRLEQDRALEQERTRIAQDLHDIMGAKLCRISFMSEHTRRHEAVPAELQEQIRSVSHDSREMLRSLDEIVWAVNPEKDTLEHLVSYVAQYAQEYFHRTGIECELVIPSRLPVRPLTSQSRHHLFLAVHEALTNILKHSGASRARVVMTCSRDQLEILINDNGAGFDPGPGGAQSPASVDGFGNGLENMRRRIGEVGGRFLLESEPGKGTTARFVLSLNGSLR